MCITLAYTVTKKVRPLSLIVHTFKVHYSFECSRTSCLRSASTRTCDQCTNRFTLASCYCTYRIQDMHASVPVIGQYCNSI